MCFRCIKLPPPSYHYAIFKGYQALGAVYIDEFVFQMKLDINEKRLVIQTRKETTQNTISFNTILYLEYCLIDSNISKHRFFIIIYFPSYHSFFLCETATVPSLNPFRNFCLTTEIWRVRPVPVVFRLLAYKRIKINHSSFNLQDTYY